MQQAILTYVELCRVTPLATSHASPALADPVLDVVLPFSGASFCIASVGLSLLHDGFRLPRASWQRICDRQGYIGDTVALSGANFGTQLHCCMGI